MKRLLSFLLLTVFAFSLVACDEDIITPDTTLDDAYQALTLEDELPAMTLPHSINDVPITWSANIDGVLDGYEIIAQDYDTEVTLNALLEYEGKTLSKLFHVTIQGESVDPGPDTTLDDAYESLTISQVLASDTLPTTYNGVTLTWSADVDGILDGNTIVSPVFDTEVTLTVIMEYDDETLTKQFTITVLGDPTEVEETLSASATALETLWNTVVANGITESVTFPTQADEISLTYFSSNPTYLTDTGVVNRPDSTTGDVTVELTITLELSGLTETITIDVLILAEESTDPVYTGYYTGADGLSGTALKTFLHNLIDDHTMRTYTQLWIDLEYTDEDPNNPNNVILIYSQLSMDEDAKCSATCPSTSSWNREHVWPKSHGGFDTGDIEGTDLHHIRPSLVTVNSTRGNLDFDEGGNLVSYTTDSYFDSDSFEPPSDVQGDIARMIFYMAVRYEGDSGELDLELNDLVNNDGPYVGKLSVLLLWHIQDPVDEFERTRNDRIYEIQGNRNPFIDHPEFVYLIWS